MNIHTAPGSKVRFTNPTGGWPNDIEKAAKHLTLNQVYVVKETSIGGWRTDVYLEEFPDKSFNSCHFENVNE